MSSSTDDERIASPLLERGTFLGVIWTLCGLATCLLASRVAIRMSTKGRLMTSDYCLFLALPALFAGTGLLYLNLTTLYAQSSVSEPSNPTSLGASAASQLTASMEMLWFSIFCVKFCFCSQFKFHKPPYAYVSVTLTRYYWFCVCICGVACLFALSQPVVLCPTAERCSYFRNSSLASALEVALIAIDMITDFFVLLIPVTLIFMANFSRIHAVVNGVFKGLSIVSIVVAATRLALICSRRTGRIDYVILMFLLQVEGAVAISMASISSYRVIILNHLNGKRHDVERTSSTAFSKLHACWSRARTQIGAGHGGPKAQHSDQHLHLALSEVSIPDPVWDTSIGSGPQETVRHVQTKHSTQPR